MSSEATFHPKKVDQSDPNSGMIGQASDAAQSKHRILRQIFDIVKPRSILNVGCGDGSWLRAASELGITDLWGVDSELDAARQPLPSVRYLNAPMLDSLSFERRFDMVISFQVAEKLPPARAGAFIADLCKAGDLILFSAATPLEEGDYLHQRWPEFWASLFYHERYSCYDLFGRQPTLTQEPGWFKQNAFVYARVSTESANTLEPWNADGMRLAHYQPETVFSILAKSNPALSPLLDQVQNQYRDDLNRVARPPGSGFINSSEKLQRRLGYELAHAQNMVAIERRGGMLIGERVGFQKGCDEERSRRDTELARVQDQHAVDIADLERKLDHAHGVVDGLRKAYFLRSMQRRERLVRLLLPGSLKHWWDQRHHERMVAIIRNSRLFDTEYYSASNPDIGESGMEPIEHYIAFGAAEGRDPSPDFDTTGYLAEHPQLSLLGINPFVHYIQTLHVS